MPPKVIPRYRNCFLTWNNPPEDWTPNVNDPITYITGQKERGESGTPHYQMYVQFSRKMTRKAICQIFEGAHVEHVISEDSAIAYVTKEDTRIEPPFELGRRKTPGKRNDIDRLFTMIRDGASDADLFEAEPGTMLYGYRAMGCYRGSLMERKQGQPCEIIDLAIPMFVPSDRKLIAEEIKDFYIPLVEGPKLWFDGYRGQNIYFPKGSPLPANFDTSIRNGWKIRLPTKGGSVPFCSSRVYYYS